MSMIRGLDCDSRGRVKNCVCPRRPCPECDGGPEVEIARCDNCGTRDDVDNMHRDDSGVYCERCQREHEERGALDAGIPLSVIRGQTKLTDHFSREYIDAQCGHLVADDE